MLLSNADHQTIERAVAAASYNQRAQMRREAMTALAKISKKMARRILFLEESKAAETAIELLVRIDAIERGKGRWFRFKRRVQLTQRYLGGAPKPTDLPRTDPHRDAIELLKFTDVALQKYLLLSHEALLARLALDFPKECYGFDLDAVTFVFPAVPDFYFTLSENGGEKSLCITGRRSYAGFTLFIPHRGFWHCAAEERGGRASAATALAREIERTFGIRNISCAWEPSMSAAA